MSFSGLNSGVDRSVPLVNGVANNAVLYCSVHISQMLLQIIHALHFCLIDLLCPTFCSQLDWCRGCLVATTNLA